MSTIKKGDKVKVEYTGMLEDGTVFDSSTIQGCPIEFEVGSGQLLKGFEEAVIGMQPGEEKEITLQPEEAYGQHKSEFVKEISSFVSNTPQPAEPILVSILSAFLRLASSRISVLICLNGIPKSSVY